MCIRDRFSYVYAPQQNLFQYCFNLNIDLFSGYFMTPHNFNGSGNVDYALNRGFCGGMYAVSYTHLDVYKRQSIFYIHNLIADIVCRLY